MSAATRYQAVREAMSELGPLASPEEVANYVKCYHGHQFSDSRVLALYIAMVQKKMSRKPRSDTLSPSGDYTVAARPA